MADEDLVGVVATAAATAVAVDISGLGGIEGPLAGLGIPARNHALDVAEADADGVDGYARVKDVELDEV